jgi:hypothetical protein
MMRYYIASHKTELYLQDSTKMLITLKKVMKRLKRKVKTTPT